MIRRRWFKPWKVEYSWTHTGYGTIVGYAWTRRRARSRLAEGIAWLVAEPPVRKWMERASS